METNDQLIETDIESLSAVEKVRFFFDNVWSAPYNVDLIDQLMVEDFEITTAGKVMSGREAFKNWVTVFLKNVENSHLETLDVFESACGTKVVVRWKLTGVNNGFMELPPKKEQFELFGTAIWLIRDNKLARNWVERNSFEVYQELTNRKA